MRPALRGDISQWNTLRLVNLIGTFERATRFASNLNAWNVSRVVTLSKTFDGSGFAGDLDQWDISILLK